ncbi:MAG: class I SAM-dependent methyltransferase, partial [Muribaculaceae bacterium]|nr:class I SAM-dependent methyltransferase [Muribaculaceae bacterium]
FDVDAAITQIECRRKFAKKLAETLAGNPRFMFPDLLSGEQSTSDLLARYHATLIADGERVIDLTAGLGIDCLHFAEKTPHVTAIEINSLKAEALKLNSEGKIQVTCTDCREYVDTYYGPAYDTAFIDPARRATDGSRVYALEQCEPDVTAILSGIFRISRKLIVKMSPMLDITRTTEELQDVRRMIALGTRAECKELIAVCGRPDGTSHHMTIEAVTLLSDGAQAAFTFSRDEELMSTPTYAEPKVGGYLYEPYPAVMKAGPFRLLSERFGVDKLSPNTHLYTSEQPVGGFPGEVSVIKDVLPYSSAVIKRLRKQYPKINVAARNFDIQADALKKKLGVKDGGDQKITATRTGNPILIVTERVHINP